MKPVLSDSETVPSSQMSQDDYQARTFALPDLVANKAEDRALFRFESILALWANGVMPRKRDLKFQDFVGWHARMVVSDLPECGDLHFRIVGDRVMDMFGHRFGYGDRFSSLPHVTFGDYADYFRAIRAGGVYGRYSGVVPFEGRDHQSFETRDLPAADEEGRPAFLFSFFFMALGRKP